MWHLHFINQLSVYDTQVFLVKCLLVECHLDWMTTKSLGKCQIVQGGWNPLHSLNISVT